MDLQNKSKEELALLVQVSEDKETLRAVADQVGVPYSGNSGVAKLKENILAELILDEHPDAPVVEEVKTADIDLDTDAPVVLADPADNDDENTELSAPDPALMAALNRHQNEKINTPPGRKSVKLPPLEVLITMNERDPDHSEPLRRAIVRSKALRLIRCRVTNLDPADSAVPGVLLSVYTKYTGKVSKLIPFGEENEAGWHIPKILLDDLKSRKFNMRKEKKRHGSSFGVKEYTTVSMRKFSIEELPPLTQDDLDHLAHDQKARGAIDHTV